MRLPRWSVAALLCAAAGVGSAVVGVLLDVPLLGVVGAVVAAVPALLAARRVQALQAEQARARPRAEQAEQALDRAGRARAARTAEQAVNALQEQPATVDLTRPATRPAAAVEAAVVPAQQPAPHLVGVAVPSTGVAAPATPLAADAQVDTAELQRIWDLGEAARTRTGRGRRVRVGAEVDALPDRPRKTAGRRRRARHRA